MNTTDNNKMTAEFMGYTQPHPEYPSTTYWYKEGKAPLTILSFDTDWNWLMEVVEKIESLDHKNNEGHFQLVSFIHHWLKCKHKELTKIEAVYNACLEFIKYYNDESKAS